LHRASAGTSVSPVATGEAMSLLQPQSRTCLARPSVVLAKDN
jgi:hypothetical protein